MKLFIVKFHHVVNGFTTPSFASFRYAKEGVVPRLNDNLLNCGISKKQKYEARVSFKRKYKCTCSFRN